MSERCLEAIVPPAPLPRADHRCRAGLHAWGGTERLGCKAFRLKKGPRLRLGGRTAQVRSRYPVRVSAFPAMANWRREAKKRHFLCLGQVNPRWPGRYFFCTGLGGRCGAGRAPLQWLRGPRARHHAANFLHQVFGFGLDGLVWTRTCWRGGRACRSGLGSSPT